MSEPKTKLHFSRFEFKYVLPRALREDVESELLNFVELDPHVQSQRHQQYFVRSLYFDDPAYTAFRDKCDGMHTRSKFRLRTYTDDPQSSAPWFLEIKGRYNNLVFKHRSPVDTRGLDRCLGGERLTRELCVRTAPGSVRDEFEYRTFRHRIHPVALVDYSRRPYVSKYDPEFRITFDAELRGTAADNLFPGPSRRARRMLPGSTVLEVKFRHHVPAWFHRVIQYYELRRRSISKICEAMEILELAEDLA